MAVWNGGNRNRKMWQTPARFAVVGMASTLLDLLLFTVLVVQFGLPAVAANSLSYSAGIVNSYVLHRRWTFAQRPHKAVRAEFLQFAMVGLTALVLNNLLILALTPPLTALLGNSTYVDLIAKLGATGAGLLWNFLMNTLWTFRAEAVAAENGH